MWDIGSRERRNGISWNFYQTIAGKMEFPSPYMAFLNWKPFLHYESFVYRAMLCRSAVICLHVGTGADAWWMTQNWFILVRYCTADALKRHERVNSFDLVLYYCSFIIRRPGTDLCFTCGVFCIIVHLLLGGPERQFRTDLCFTCDVFFVSPAFSQVPRPIVAKLCHVIGNWLNL